MTAEAVGYFCQMNIIEHAGPKAQIFLKDNPNALFFGQVRDAIAFQRMPEQTGEVVAIYVSDMANAPDWERSGADNWLAGEKALYVTGSSRMGGMGIPEAVPFSDLDAAKEFVAEFGGEISGLDEIADEEVFGPAGSDPVGAEPDNTSAVTSEHDYAARLRGLSKHAKEPQ